MMLGKMIRVLCLGSVAAVALMGICSQSLVSGSNASVGEDFLILSRTAQPAATAAPVLKGWQYTRERPPKCPFI